MCGITGIYSQKGQAIDLDLLRAMTDLISHRGPDDEGYLLAARDAGVQLLSGPSSTSEIKAKYPLFGTQARDKATLGLGFKRLSILELSPIGHQPMWDKQLHIALVFNGEIYNYLELKEELGALGYSFFSRSDSEVIIKAYHAWGDECTKRFIGMWAFALWDAKKQSLFCSRDRYGIKPFYYAFEEGFFFFGSEIKQLLRIPQGKELNKAMIWRSMKINSLLAYDDETYWQNIHTLKPGTNLIINQELIKTRSYYSLNVDNFETSTLAYHKAVEEYRRIFLDSISMQLRSDVPVGASLSGGMDSSAIVCSAVRHLAEPIKTFSSYYRDSPELDERKWIQAVNHETGCEAHLVSPGANQAIAWWEKATYLNDLPIAAGFVSQYAVMQEAHRQGIKVLLSGQGSDEITAGYKHAAYRYFADLLRTMQTGKLSRELPQYLRKQKAGIKALGKIALSALFPESALYRMEFCYYRFEPFTHEFQSLAERQAEDQILAQITDIKASRLSNFLYNMMQNTSIQTLLHFEDRLSMAHSVESRVPFLDHRLVDFVFSLPSKYKIKPPYTKIIHREAMKELIPEKIYRRKDKGIFSSPFYALWMKGEMKNYISDILTSTAFRQRDLWNLPRINHHWQRYLAGDNRNAEMLYNVIALELWFRVYGV